jgi:hypothetical protein
MRDGSPLFIKTFDMLEWLLAHTAKFPKSHRFGLAKRMDDAALDFSDALLWALKAPDKRAVLLHADGALERLRFYNRLAVRLRLQTPAQQEHLAKQLDELGRLVGGWLRALGGGGGSAPERR